MKLIRAVVKDETFIVEVEKYQHDENNFHLWWLGQSGYLLLWKGKQVLIDPYLSDSLTKKYAATNKPHGKQPMVHFAATNPAATKILIL